MSDNLMVGEWLREYIDSRTGVTAQTLYTYRLYVAGMPAALTTTPLPQLTRRHIAKWIRLMEDGQCAASTIRNRYAFMAGAMKEAVRDGLIPANPAAEHRLPRKSPTRPLSHQALTPAQFAVLTSHFTEHWRPFVRFLAASGARFGEAVALTADDINPDTGEVFIDKAYGYTVGVGYRVGATKTVRSDRVITVDPRLLAELDCSHETLFTSTRGNPVRYKSFHQNMWIPAVARAKLGFNPRIHDLRHTCATWMFAAGATPKQVQQHLGHEAVKTTLEIYAHTHRSQEADTAKKIRDMLGEV